MLFFLFCLNVVAVAQDGYRYPVSLTTLENGMHVVITEMPESELVSIYALVKAGSAQEGPYLGSGLTHYIEHLLFKGTARRGVGDIAHEIQQLGGTINASTGKDHTMFTITLPREHFERGLDIIADMLVHPAFDPKEMEKEKQVIVKEIRLHRDRPESYLSEIIFDTAFLIHPYRIPIVGFEEVFLRLTREDVLRYYHSVYVPNNIILSIAGGVAKIEVLPLVEKNFKEFKRQTEVIRNLPKEPVQIVPRRRVEEYPTDLTRMSLNFKSVPLSDPDLYALDVLAMILGRGQSSRLYKDLFRKRGLVESIYASNYTPIDRGLFDIRADINHNDIDKVADLLFEHIQDIQTKGVQAAELKKAQRQVISNYVRDYQRTSDYAYHTAMDQGFAGDYDFYRKYIQGIQGVTNEDIRKVAQKYLIPSRSNLVVLKPKQITEEAGKFQKAGLLPLKIIVLENGLRILLKEDHAIPLISIVLAAKGGVHTEPADKNGLSALMTQAWTQGTRRFSASQIATETESRGAALGSYTSHDSIGLSMNLLAQDIEFGLDLFADVILHPTFDFQEIEKERGKILTAIIKRKDNVFTQTIMELQKNLFTNYYLGRTELGTEDSVNRVNRDDILDYYAQYVQPNNMVLSVFGDFDTASIEKQLRKKFERWGQDTQDPGLGHPEELGGIDTHAIDLQTEKTQAIVMAGFRAVGRSHPDRYGIELLTSILGSSFEGRIFNKIREEFGQAYTLGGYFIPAQDQGMMVFYVATTNQYVERVKELLLGIFAEIREKGVTQAEMEDMRSYLKGRHQRGLETLTAVGSRMALDTLFGLGHDHYKKYNDEINKVSADQVLTLAQRYLQPTQAVVVTSLGQQGDASGEINE